MRENLNSDKIISKIKYETKIYNLEKNKSDLLKRFTVNANGTVKINVSLAKNIIYKTKDDVDHVAELFNALICCIFGNGNRLEIPVDDISRCLTLYYKDGSSDKINGIVICGDMNTETILQNYIDEI